MLEQTAVRVLDEYLLDFRLVHLHLYLNLGAIWKLTSLLIVLNLKLVAAARYYKGLIYGSNHLGAVEGGVVEFLQALVLLYLFRPNAIRFRRRVARVS
jgi:hypothetical protein